MLAYRNPKNIFPRYPEILLDNNWITWFTPLLKITKSKNFATLDKIHDNAKKAHSFGKLDYQELQCIMMFLDSLKMGYLQSAGFMCKITESCDHCSRNIPCSIYFYWHQYYLEQDDLSKNKSLCLFLRTHYQEFTKEDAKQLDIYYPEIFSLSGN